MVHPRRPAPVRCGVLSVLTTAHRRHVLTVPAVSATVTLARRTGEQAWAAWGVNPSHRVLGPALLILTELVANSVRHAAHVSPNIDVIYAHGDGVLAFAVHDRHPFVPSIPPQTHADGGHGLAVAAELVAEHDGTATVRPDIDHRGKTVWVTLPL
ncbi:ATP-binding protein [Yinghuangia sp. ASG 101]|uniref:ATP-binding protein n=1 Tax=Yinghuangia sp. ASG 101 TaxID=2896848 RepID=UPI001E5BA1D0|nr:ATP-binding protein [Yinghuangia sp. ASG 101]UGQ12991.1 ATP-binding protein [Yinghuangia sp. ASG 101]